MTSMNARRSCLGPAFLPGAGFGLLAPVPFGKLLLAGMFLMRPSCTVCQVVHQKQLAPSPSSLSHALRCQVQCGDIVTAAAGIVAVEGRSEKNYTAGLL